MIFPLILALLTYSPVASAQTGGFDAATFFDSSAAALRFAQNDDGGWGRLDTRGDTVEGSANLRLSAWAGAALLDLGTDPLAEWRNRHNASVSLASSNASNALDWLRGAEGAVARFGDAALLAATYHRLGDPHNSRRLADDLARVQAANGTWGGSAAETAQVVRALAGERWLPRAVNESLARAADHLAGLDAADARLDAEALAWSALALDAAGRPQRAADLAAALSNRSASSPESAAAVVWATAVAGDAAAAEQRLAALAARPLPGLARIVALEAVASAHPELREGYELVWGEPLSAAAAGRIPAPAPLVPQAVLRELRERLEALEGERAATEGERERLAERIARAAERPALAMPPLAMAAAAALYSGAVVVVGATLLLHRERLGGSRQVIFDYITANPGEHLNSIRRALTLAPGTALYHLHALERGGWIVSHRGARYKRFYASGNPVQQLLQGRDYKEKHSALKNESARALVAFVRDHPGCGQKLVSESLGLHPSTVNWHVGRLKEAGLLRDERAGKEVHYHLVDQGLVDKVLRQLGPPPPPAS